MLRTTIFLMFPLLMLLVVKASQEEETVGNNMGLRILKRKGTQLDRITKAGDGWRLWRDMKRNQVRKIEPEEILMRKEPKNYLLVLMTNTPMENYY